MLRMRGMESGGDNAARNFAILRRIAMTCCGVIRRSSPTGIKIRRLKAATSDRYRTELLGW
ncbi:hypothetical protein [Burkholderia ubonensis]|uniref:hypothetical protein n=1 Tax=Burkholderia ubonensis TaxID=101571 RepID=UPI000754CDD6|nr:hypothetical protein [Burkholderia ubonensis]KVO92436.1 hypothetical protein WJ82_05825 [Burkholderia ubonensis]KVU23179.1 hypothetical protein WK65_17270 [Burkholderia ubonensis]